MARSCSYCISPISSILITVATFLLFLAALVNSKPTENAAEDRCIDFELNKIDAITSLANGSLFMVNNDQYWVLKPNQVPSQFSARPVSRLFVTENDKGNIFQQGEKLTIDAAVNVRVKAQNGACVPANQIFLYSWSNTNRSLVTVYENDVLFSTTNISHVDIFRSAKSVDWTRKIDGLAFWQNMTIIFQGNLLSLSI